MRCEEDQLNALLEPGAFSDANIAAMLRLPLRPYVPPAIWQDLVADEPIIISPLIEIEGTTGTIEEPIILNKATLDRLAATHRPPDVWFDSPEEDLFS